LGWREAGQDLDVCRDEILLPLFPVKDGQADKILALVEKFFEAIWRFPNSWS